MYDTIKRIAQIRPKDLAVEIAKEIEILKALADGRPLVYYIGWTGHGNLGDEILLEAHIRLFPDLRFVPFKRNSPANFIINKIKKDGYIAGFLGGGTLINQSPTWLKRIEFIQNLNLPVYCLGTGVTEDKFKFDFETTTLDEWFHALDKMKFVGIRGNKSFKLLKTAGFNKTEVVGDTALALAPAKMRSKRNNDIKIIGLNYGLSKKMLMWGNERTYRSQMIKTIKILLKSGYEVRLLPIWSDDIVSNQTLVDEINDKRCNMRLAFQNLNSYQDELNQCDIFIGQKLHSTIIACMNRIPSIMIEYQPKCMDFMESLGLDDYVVKTSEYTSDVVIGLINKLKKEYDDIRNVIDKKVVEYQKIQCREARKIEASLIGSKKVK